LVVRHARISRVDVHFHRRRDLAAHHRALIEVQVLERVHDPSDVVQILGGRIPIQARLAIHDVNRGARGAEIHSRSPRLHVVFRVLAVEHEVPGGPRDGIFHQRAREDQPAGGVELRPSLGHVVDAARGRIREPDVLQHVQRGMMDAQHIRVRQGLVSAARHAGTHGTQVVGQRSRPRGAPRRTRAAARDLGFNFAHRGPSLQIDRSTARF
jgi:hypothetical protein